MDKSSLRCPKCGLEPLDAWFIIDSLGNRIAWILCPEHKKLALGKRPHLKLPLHQSNRQKRAARESKGVYPKKRATLTTDISNKDAAITKQLWKKKRGNILQARNEWLAKKKAAHIEAGLYRKTIGGKTFIYRPLGEHLWERTSEDGKLRTLVKHLPDYLD